MAQTGGGKFLNRTAAPRRAPDSIFYRPNQTTPSRGATVVRSAPAAAAAPGPVPSYGGGGGGGGYGGGGGGGFAAPAAAAAPPRPSLREFIDNDLSYRQANDEFGDTGRRMREFDAETSRLRGETERDQAVRRQDLEQDAIGESQDLANDFAGRGLLRSGGIFQQQDILNQDVGRRRSAIDDILTDFLSNRQGSRVQQQAANRQALNERLASLTNQYTSQYGI